MRQNIERADSNCQFYALKRAQPQSTEMLLTKLQQINQLPMHSLSQQLLTQIANENGIWNAIY